VWDLESGDELRTLAGHTGWVNGVAVSGDGRRAISASSDQTLKVWDVESGEEIATFTCDGAALCCVFASLTKIVAGDAGGRVHFLELISERKESKGRQAVSKTGSTAVRTERTMANEKAQKKHVFLSYCRDNLEEVRRLREELVAAGETVWWDQEIVGGQDWKFEIRKAMKSAYAVLLCLSRESAARTTSGIYPEALDAINFYREYAPGGVFLIPVRLSECDIPPLELDGTRTLDRLQYVDLFPAGKYAAGVKNLLAAIRKTPHHPSQARGK